jgi:hypothetical protein
MCLNLNVCLPDEKHLATLLGNTVAGIFLLSVSSAFAT